VLEYRGSDLVFDWSRKFDEGSRKRGNRWFGSNILQKFIAIGNSPRGGVLYTIGSREPKGCPRTEVIGGPFCVLIIKMLRV